MERERLENMVRGYENFKKQVEEAHTMDIDGQLELLQNIKVLEWRASAQSDLRNVFYAAQNLIVELKTKIKSNLK